MEKITCFKAYDVRGRIPDQLNEDIARRIGRAYAEVIKPSRVVVGHECAWYPRAVTWPPTGAHRECGAQTVLGTRPVQGAGRGLLELTGGVPLLLIIHLLLLELDDILQSPEGHESVVR